MRKGQSLLWIAVSVAVIAIFATILWGILSPMTTLPGAVTNETINFAINDTYYEFTKTSENVLTVTSVTNTTVTVPTDRYSFDNTNDKIKFYDNGSYVVGNYNVSYTWRYDTYLTKAMERNMMGYVFTFFILGILVLAGAYVWELKR